ncbi:WD40-repeat-containing domain protein [Mycena floridula]|nr:WD40-repeat-containing domain protein [Mycena floridula]
MFIWDKVVQQLARLDIAKSSTGILTSPVHGTQATRLEEITKFRAAGSINRIVQRRGHVVVAAATPGGHDSDVEDNQLIYNRRGALVHYNSGLRTPHDDPDAYTSFLDEHSKQHGATIKYYTVNEVAFDPTSDNTFVSSANDGTIRQWGPDVAIKDGQKVQPVNSNILTLGKTISIVFKPGSSSFAVGGSHITIYRNPKSRNPLYRFKYNDRILVGALLWGCEQTENQLFACGEGKGIGAHIAFDAAVGKPLHYLDATESGDELAVKVDGSELALFTEADSVNRLHLYDIKTKMRKAHTKISLVPFKAGGEVNCAVYSPDGIYLAVSRTDNHCHIYDTRNLKRGILHDFQHSGPSQVSSDPYGVVRAEWITSHSGRLGLVTGGEDGCIRLWSPLRHTGSSGRIVAKTASDIAYFSLGDKHTEEYDLVVGDGAGDVTIFDSQVPFFSLCDM